MNKEELSKSEREIFEESATETAEYLLEVLQKVLRNHYNWGEGEIIEILLFMASEMMNRSSEDEKDVE